MPCGTPCSESHCQACHKDMPSGAAYAYCFECGHVWQTSAEFLAHWRSTWEGLSIHPDIRADLETVRPEEIFICPCCSHDL